MKPNKHRRFKCFERVCRMKKIIVSITTLLLLLITYLTHYDAHQAIKIGFVGELSTNTSQLSVESRESFLYVIDQVNEKGGIGGRKIIPKIYDNKFDNDYKATLNRKLKTQTTFI